VSGGYRPSKPNKMAEELWQLVDDCWKQDPLERPDMGEVVRRLEQLIELESSGQLQGSGGGEGGCCTVM
jgi:hypothetical protein